MVTLLPVRPVSLSILFLLSSHDTFILFTAAHDPTDNLRFNFQPAAITFPNTTQDVSTIMQITQKFNYSVVARSGGVRFFVTQHQAYISEGLSSIAILLMVLAEWTAL